MLKIFFIWCRGLFERLIFRWLPTWYYERRKRDLDFEQHEALAAAYASGDESDIQLARGYFAQQEQELEEEIDSFYSEHVQKEALKLRVPVPSRADRAYWTRNGDGGPFILNEDGVAKVKAAVRAERKARHEELTRWIPWVSALSTVIAICTALAAVMKS